tara:strand:+ start:2421 stop:2576 length:156 start_codon:yes stop_codon:yes gene_type:complete
MDVTDLKIYTLNATALGVSMTDIDIVLKIILLAVSIGYTIQKWYLLNGKNK